ncbi:sigma-70 family RNA polymerase sigma factor [Pseudonocardia spinosispora]|uniref:sigma-70 family RNA polymerase sigma factor n=1 Tax=Pseudonocardia spinosispora TaxID=103441 RepID=UPI0003F910BF|nr:sigma-70 family RNA polymerase sigma factor [Pseudonocardia spinosispora]
MDENDWLARHFEEQRGHLHAVAYRMLGSTGEADDAVQEAWLRLSRSDTQDVQNLAGWLTTVVARVSLNMLRSRSTRREEPLDDIAPESPSTDPNPEQQAELADSVGLALLVVLETLAPAERLAFVLHDMFAMPFEEIAPIVDRSPAAARQLASRARRRVQGTATVPRPDLTRQREVVDAFLAAARGGDFDALVAVLDPDVVLRTDGFTAPEGTPRELRGASEVAGQALFFSRRSPFSVPALVDGRVGLVVAPGGRLMVAMAVTISGDRITELDVIGDPARLDRLDLAILGR